MKILKEEGWKTELTPEQFRILREKGTEIAGSGEYVDADEKGARAYANVVIQELENLEK